MPGASIAGRQLATVFLNYLASLQRVGKPPARDHPTELRSSKPAALRTVEPVFDNLRYNKPLDRFTLRGRKKVDAQWKLYSLVRNIEKLVHQGFGQ
jgi:hypothetical protein